MLKSTKNWFIVQKPGVAEPIVGLVIYGISRQLKMRKGLEPRRRRSEVAVVELVETTRTEEWSDSGMAESPTRQGCARKSNIWR